MILRSWLLAALATARAGYITVGMTDAHQCGTSTVEWYGDDGPYHLLLTPTTFSSHGYNVWVPSIANGTTAYNLTIKQPAGLQYLVTVWGASGIEYAGTTDVQTVLPSATNDASCFLPNADIASLYTFAFNISNTNAGFPPQCSNLSMAWPTSLESPTLPPRTRSLGGDDDEEETDPDEPRPVDDLGERQAGAAQTSFAPSLPGTLDADTSSSNKTQGNTTTPPTMFGIIPLGNSFSIPITYSPKSKFVHGLPESSWSDTPTTWTSQGVTHLNWTVSLAKGTRFILVAGIGSHEEWASGGSSEMMTVGQGDSSCANAGSAPSITASESKTGPIRKPTASASSDSTSSTGSGPNIAGVVLACVFSALATLLLAVVFYCCCRIRNKRRRATKQGLPKPSVVSVATFGRIDTKRRKQPQRYEGEQAGDVRLDLIADRDDASDGTRPISTVSDATRPQSHFSVSSRPPPITTSPLRRYDGELFGSPAYSSPGYSSPVELDSYHDYTPQMTGYSSAQLSARARGDDYAPLSPRAGRDEYSPLSSPTRAPESSSSDRLGDIRTDLIGRPPSLDQLIAYPALAVTPPRRGLQLHDPEEAGSEALGQLKRDTLAALDGQPGSPTAPVPGPSLPRRRRERGEATYLVHRDAGRVLGGPRRPRNVLELPPRYEELNWDEEEDGPAPLTINTSAGSAQSASASPATPVPPSAANIPLPHSPMLSQTWDIPPPDHTP
ncbi:uncharacterized protein LOC62_02G002326 [Vanrija pseudolonga]|uniref:Mid2 domain-containing protein n=1 Tax=Vanrija pseudolonga TaxID=143232 RepID=A0AAF0Y8D7_9TREE|nr:hypothetical protein LOC62_02G002326 [Vanrija pseudolonga]